MGLYIVETAYRCVEYGHLLGVDFNELTADNNLKGFLRQELVDNMATHLKLYLPGVTQDVFVYVILLHRGGKGDDYPPR